jgi:hypothetical protein
MIPITLAEKAQAIAERKTALGIEGMNYVAPNSGARRTEPKKAMVSNIAWVRKLDGEPVVLVEFKGDKAEVRVGDKYRVMDRSSWASLPVYDGRLFPLAGD